MIVLRPSEIQELTEFLLRAGRVDLMDAEVKLEDTDFDARLRDSRSNFPEQSLEWLKAHIAYAELTRNRVSVETTASLPEGALKDLRRFADAAELQSRGFNALRSGQEALVKRFAEAAAHIEHLTTEQAAHFDDVTRFAREGLDAETRAAVQREGLNRTVGNAASEIIAAVHRTHSLVAEQIQEARKDVRETGTAYAAAVDELVSGEVRELIGHQAENTQKIGALIHAAAQTARETVLDQRAVLAAQIGGDIEAGASKVCAAVNESRQVIIVELAALRAELSAYRESTGLERREMRRGAFWAWLGITFLLLLIFGATVARAQVTTVRGTVTANAGTGTFTMNLSQLGGTALSGANVVDVPNTAFRVNCIVGCAGSSFADNSLFTAGTTTISNSGGVYNDALANVTATNAAAFRITLQRALHVHLRDSAGNEIASAIAQPAGTERGLIVREAQKGQATMANSRPVVIASDQAAVPVSGTFWQATQPVSGTVTSNQGTAAAVAGAWPIKLVDTAGVNVAVVSAANALKVDGSAVTQPVSGTFWQATQPVSGTVTVTDGAGALNVIIDSGTTVVTQATATNLRVAGGDAAGAPTAGTVLAVQGIAGGTTVPVSGTVTVTDGAGALNVIVDSGTTTVTQATATNLRVAGGDAAGAPTAGTVLAVQGIASGTAVPVSGTVTANQGTNNATPWNENVAQVGGTATVNGGLAGTLGIGGAAAVGAAYTTNPVPQGLLSASSLAQIHAAVSAVGDANTGNNIATSGGYVYNGATWDKARGTTVGTWVQGPTADAAALTGNPVRIAGSDGTNARNWFADPCQREARTTFVVNISTATTTVITTATASQRVYICSFVLFSAGTQNIALVEGTGGTCGTGTAGMAGGATAATGFNLTAQTGIAFGNGQGYVFATAGTNVDVCLISSAAVQVSGAITWVKDP